MFIADWICLRIDGWEVVWEGGWKKKSKNWPKLIQLCLPSCISTSGVQMLALSWSSQWGEIQWDLYVPWHEWCYLIPVPSAPLIFSYRQGPHIASMGKVSSEWLEPGHLSWFQLVPEKLTHPYPLPCPGESLKAQANLCLLCLCGALFRMFFPQFSRMEVETTLHIWESSKASGATSWVLSRSL